ncbi:hypothetical protein [Phaeodactylibacter sp.]|jgi:hypothetical protein|uniref:hypothetical protein n=1 Tax=Phaeodactylibacter sp. TaxID=1940289 RepID=UPI0025F8B7CC|nr:hypothetical protein [Phaeodactylibacter sp.]MCI4646892.1 hypothetical protein [Phaeodactylibacter sp.]MCI5089976.1 hypothetical protein [Phaeodactylibacter sp.]
MTAFKTILSQVLLEVPAVVLAVFLALAVNNCNEERKQEAAAAKTMEAILLEVKQNRSALENNLKDNRLRSQQLSAARDTIKLKGTADGIDLELGYDQTFLSRAAWEMAQITGATQHFAPELVQQLSLLYDLQNMYLEQGNQFLQQIATVDFYQAADHPKAQLDATLGLIHLAEAIGQSTLEQYNNFLKTYQ